MCLSVNVFKYTLSEFPVPKNDPNESLTSPWCWGLMRTNKVCAFANRCFLVFEIHCINFLILFFFPAFSFFSLFFFSAFLSSSFPSYNYSSSGGRCSDPRLNDNHLFMLTV